MGVGRQVYLFIVFNKVACQKITPSCAVQRSALERHYKTLCLEYDRCRSVQTAVMGSRALEYKSNMSTVTFNVTLGAKPTAHVHLKSSRLDVKSGRNVWFPLKLST